MSFLNYSGMPRQCATYNVSAAPINIMELFCIRNIVQPGFEVPVLKDADLWNLKKLNQPTRKWGWNGRSLETVVTNCSEKSDSVDEKQKGKSGVEQ